MLRQRKDLQWVAFEWDKQCGFSRREWFIARTAMYHKLLNSLKYWVLSQRTHTALKIWSPNVWREWRFRDLRGTNNVTRQCLNFQMIFWFAINPAGKVDAKNLEIDQVTNNWSNRFFVMIWQQCGVCVSSQGWRRKSKRSPRRANWKTVKGAETYSLPHVNILSDLRMDRFAFNEFIELIVCPSCKHSFKFENEYIWIQWVHWTHSMSFM
jgi:hypothetical protein